jgi:DNA-binding CsgD family transcriptional regulator
VPPKVTPENLIDRIYDAALFPDAWPALLQDLAGTVEAAGCTLLTRRNDNWVGWRLSPGMSAYNGDVYLTSEAAQRSRTTAAMIAANHAGFVADHDVMGDEEFLSDPMMTEWGTPAGLHRVAATAIFVPGGDTAVYHIQRRAGRPRFTSEELGLLDRLRPHLARSAMLAARWRLERLRAATEALALIGVPAGILDAGGHVLATNAPLEALTDHVVWRTRNRLSLCDAAADETLQSACIRAAWSEGSGGQSLPARAAGGGAPIVVHIVPLRGRGRELFGGGLTLLAVSRVGQGKAPDAAVIQGLFDLTAAEARVAHGLLSGASAPELARRHGVSRETVRTQVKSILAKSGVRRQAEFLGLLRSAIANE